MNKNLKTVDTLRERERERNALKNKKERAITLIALVITIVILIILAGVLVNLSIGDNGLFTRAKTAKEMYTNAQDYEETEIAKMSNQIDGYLESSPKKTLLLNSNQQEGIKVQHYTSYPIDDTTTYELFDGSTNTPITTNYYIGTLFGKDTSTNSILIEFPHKVLFDSYHLESGSDISKFGVGVVDSTNIWGSNDGENYFLIASEWINDKYESYRSEKYQYYKIFIYGDTEWISVTEVNFKYYD